MMESAEPPTLQRTIRNDAADIEFAIYACRPLTNDECTHAIALFITSRQRHPKPGSRLSVFADIGPS